MKQPQGYIHIYKGEGKGKTSILNGSIVRALGRDWHVKYIRFLKNTPSGELLFFQKYHIHNLEIINTYHFSIKFVWEMNDAEKNKFKEETQHGFEQMKVLLQDDTVDYVLADEILGAIENGFLDEQEVIASLKNKKPHIEVALSGRYCSDKLMAVADLVSEIIPNKHYFDKKVYAREGVEY